MSDDIDDENGPLYTTKDYGDHLIIIVAEKRQGGCDIVVACAQCDQHFHRENLDFGDHASTMVLEAELQMHASGVSDGWAEGVGFSLD